MHPEDVPLTEGAEVDFGVVVPTWGTWADAGAIRETVQALEELGYDTAWFGDHIVVPSYATPISTTSWFEPLSCAFVAAGATSRIRFAFDVLVLPYRHPVWLAKLLSSADHLSGGRVTLGVGVGFLKGEYAALTSAPYRRRGAVTDEYLRVLHLLWESDEAVSFDGEWVQFEDVWAHPRPLQQPFPVWVGGNAPAALRRAATLGNGWHPLFLTPEGYAAGRARILELRAAAGLEGAFTFSYSASDTCVLLQDEEPRSVPSMPEGWAPPEDYGYSPSPPTDANGRVLLTGTPEQVAADVQDLRRAGVDHVALRFGLGFEPLDVEGFVARAERFRTHVLPLL
jgi:probable F420-dependent oxidoreductase